MPQPPDTRSCPLCQQDNHCGVSDISTCWCKDEPIPAALQQRVPEHLQNKACICQRCAQTFKGELAYPARK